MSNMANLIFQNGIVSMVRNIKHSGEQTLSSLNNGFINPQQSIEFLQGPIL